jgi:SNF2 family DNA or RNA helicase
VVSYQELIKQFRKPKPSDYPDAKDPAVPDEVFEEFREKTCRDCGILFTVDWYRVILDEAHQIKNHRSQG